MLVNMKIDRRTLFVVGQKFLFIIFSHWIFFSLELKCDCFEINLFGVI